MFVYFQRIAVSNAVKTVADLSIPPNTFYAELQADASAITDGVYYTMDGTTPTVALGMILPPNVQSRPFAIEDLRRIKFIRRGANDTGLLVHYIGSETH